MLMKKKRLSLNTMKEQVTEKMYPVLCSTGVIFGGMVGNVCYADINPDELMSKIGDKIYDVFKYIGFILTLWGVGQLVLAFKNEDADSKSRAIMCIVAGVLLFGLKAFLKTVGIKLN